MEFLLRALNFKLHFLARPAGMVSLLVAAAYLLGMFSGWTVVGMLRRSVYRATEPREYARY